MKSPHKHQFPDERSMSAAPVSRGQCTQTRKIIRLVAIGLLSAVMIFSGSAGVMVSSVLGRIDRAEITGNPSATFEGKINLVSDDDWIDQMLEGQSSAQTVSDAADLVPEQQTSSAAASSGSAKDVAQTVIDHKVTQTKTDYQLAQEIPVFQDPDVQNMVLIGADKVGLGDSTILVSINRKTGKIHLSSLMRAMYVRIPGNGWFMFNHAYAWGGPKLVIQTIETNFRIKVDDYIVVNFDSFPKVIDVIGGVDLTLTQAEADYLTQDGHPTEAGTVHFNGDYALAYSRIRYIDTDFNRTNRQRNVIQSAIRKAMNTNAGELLTLAGELAAMVNTSLTDQEILSLAAEAPKLINYSIDQTMLPVENDTSNGKSASFAGRIYIPYSSTSNLRVEAYAVNFTKNVQTLRAFVQS